MAKYSVLVIGKEIEGRSAKLGDVAAYKKHPCAWGRKEVPPRFQAIQIEGEFENINELRNAARYDFDRKKFIRKDTGKDFEFYNKIAGSYIMNESMQEIAALELSDGLKPPNLCNFLNIFEYLKMRTGRQRRYFLKVFFKFRNCEGIEKLLLLIKRGLYGEIRECLKNLPADTKKILKKELTSEDLEALQEKWKVLT